MSNVVIFHNFILTKNKGIDDNYNDKELVKSPKTSDPNLNDYINGTGVNQDVRIYGNNKSKNLNDNQEFFEIPTYNSDDMYLTYGDFNFTFQNNFTTDYIIEDHDALYPLGDFILYDFNSDYSGIEYNITAYLSGIYDNMFDGNNESWLELKSYKGVLNFTIIANFSDILSNYYSLEFNRSHILGLIPTLIYSIETIDANLTIQIKDFTQPIWNIVTEKIFINHSLGTQELQKRFINTNLNYINLSNICEIQFIFERWDTAEYKIKDDVPYISFLNREKIM